MAGSNEASIGLVESMVEIHFADSHRQLLLEHDGWETSIGGTPIMFYSVEEIETLHRQWLEEAPSDLTGFVAVASDGSRELIGYDRRFSPAPVVMIDITAEDWSSAMLQGVTFDGFLDRLRSGQGYDFETCYVGPSR